MLTVSERIMTLLPPTPEQKAVIDKKLIQDNEKTQKDIDTVLEWISQHPELNISKDFADRKFLERFLYGCKFNLNKTIKKLENYIKIRRDVPEFFQNRDPASPELTQSFNTIYMFTLPELSNDGYRISFCGLLDPDTEKFSATDMSTRSLMHFDIRLQEECCLGDIYVMDLALFSISHLKQYSVSFIKKSVMCQMDAMPFRVKGIHFLNSSLIVAGFIKIFKLFLNEKQRNRIFVHYDDHKTLHKYISKDILPKEFQGQGPSIVDLNNSWRDKLMSYREWFLQQCNN
ncbi:retinol-binding protein pinta-like isoform X2 [Lycorma delicatula]|uniref:retinol-binding protein pinta-like isoform X2 n=1 Tax=Lycorma delicatula TaxID=130591 RepID=UPI003F50D551